MPSTLKPELLSPAELQKLSLRSSKAVDKMINICYRIIFYIYILIIIIIIYNNNNDDDDDDDSNNNK